MHTLPPQPPLPPRHAAAKLPDSSASKAAILIAPLLALTCLLPPGCTSLEQPALAKSYFALDPGPPSSPAPRRCAASGSAVHREVLTILPLHIAPPYDGLSFVYKTAPNQFDFDRYNIFVAPPASLLTGSLITWLNRAGPCTAVSDASPLRSDLQLQCEITALYIDSTAAPHKAVITGRFFLLRQRPSQTDLLADFPFTAVSPVAANSPPSFARSLSQSWRQVLTDLTDHLEKDPPSGSRQP